MTPRIPTAEIERILAIKDSVLVAYHVGPIARPVLEELLEARKDVERMDWMEAHVGDVPPNHLEGENLRAAIDALLGKAST